MKGPQEAGVRQQLLDEAAGETGTQNRAGQSAVKLFTVRQRADTLYQPRVSPQANIQDRD